VSFNSLLKVISLSNVVSLTFLSLYNINKEHFQIFCTLVPSRSCGTRILVTPKRDGTNCAAPRFVLRSFSEGGLSTAVAFFDRRSFSEVGGEGVFLIRHKINQLFRFCKKRKYCSMYVCDPPDESGHALRGFRIRSNASHLVSGGFRGRL